jgi:acetyl esterase
MKNIIDPRLQELCARGKATPIEIECLTADVVRAEDLAVLELQRPGAKLHSVEDLAIPESGVCSRLYRPKPGPLPTIVYFHGGGFVIGPAGCDQPLRDLAFATGCLIIAPNVRLAPEHPFPSAVEDALHSARWFCARTMALTGVEGPVGIAGDSSGGNLAAVATRELSRAGVPLDFQVLICPMLDATASSPTYREFATGYGFTREKALWYFSQYLSADADRHDPRVSPLFEQDLSGLPPTLVIVAGCDPLRDEGKQYAKAIQTAGGHSTVRSYDDMIHGFFQMTALVGGADRAQNDIAKWVGAVTNRRGWS